MEETQKRMTMELHTTNGVNDATWMTSTEEACWNPQGPAMSHEWMGSLDLDNSRK